MRRDVHGLANQVFDVLVVGGGIHGAWVALDASLRGLSVGLIEAGDFANATSSNSLKIVHGGLRYLQSADFRRMRESIRERAILLRVASHLVSPLPCLLPLYGHGMRGPEVMRAALAMTDMVGFDRNRGAQSSHSLPRGRIISAEECFRIAPGITRDGLTGGAVWYDAQMHNDARLVLAVLQSAAEWGVVLANYVAADGLSVHEGRVSAIQATDQLSGNRLDIRARAVVNAAGPWALSLFAGEHGISPPGGLQLSKAMNLAVPRLFDEFAVGLSTAGSADGKSRLLFATPWRDHSLIGTMHLPYSGDGGEFRITEQDVQDFIEDFNSAFPMVALSTGDVKRVYGGLLAAVGLDRHNEVVLPGRHVVHRLRTHGGPSGLISLVSIKFTTARLAAEDAVAAVFRELGFERPPHCVTHFTPLAGEESESPQAMAPQFERSRAAEVPSLTVENLARNHGSRVDRLFRLIHEDPGLADPVWADSPTIKAEVVYAVREEMARCTADVIFRRTDLGFAGAVPPDVEQTCAALIAREQAIETDHADGSTNVHVDGIHVPSLASHAAEGGGVASG